VEKGKVYFWWKRTSPEVTGDGTSIHREAAGDVSKNGDHMAGEIFAQTERSRNVEMGDTLATIVLSITGRQVRLVEVFKMKNKNYSNTRSVYGFH
jgi:hypothetical protein